MKVALIGNPNSGKTTLFNEITGSIEHVGNWPGVTVAKKEGTIKPKYNRNDKDITIVDLPGAYSLNPFTSEEGVTSEFILKENPDIIINIVEATNLSRSLFFTTQLLELNIPVVIALNKSDLLEKKNIAIDRMMLSHELNCPVVNTSSIESKDNGLDRLIDECVRSLKFKEGQKAPKIDGLKKATTEKQYRAAERKRYSFINEVVAEVERKKLNSNQQTKQDKIDRIVAHKWIGIPIFAIVMYLIFFVSQSWIGPTLADALVGVLESFQSYVAALVSGVNPVISSLLVDGIIGGVIAVIGFLPLIMIMFFLMALIEDCGYMARVAVVMDRFFKKIGLSGKSIIPMVIGTACGIPGVMASRTIKDDRQRRTTAMLTPFMPCGAKLPVISLFAGAFFAGSALVTTSMYFLAIFVILFSALIIRKITGDSSKSYFILELPDYRIPSLKRATISMFSRAKGFIIKASTIILISNTVVQLMQTFNWHLEVAQNANDSILASIAHPLAILFVPLGFGVWQFAAASITGFIAKENVVGTLAVVFGISNLIDPDALEMVSGSATGIEQAFGLTTVAALSFLIFNLFTPPCFACMGAIRSEMDSKWWTIGAIGYQLSVGYVLSFVTYQFGTLITTGNFGVGFVPGLIVVAIIVVIIGYFMFRHKEA